MRTSGRLIPSYVVIVIALVCVTRACFAQTLPGFSLNGESWTYVTAQHTNTGILCKPAGSGPFPAVIISHGKGSSATGFSLPKAREMTNWGFVCIGPTYTHAAGSTITNMDGASPENIRRALDCVTILRSLSYVDTNRIAAYGNSMGAFVTIALAAELTNVLDAAAITAGGVVTTPGYAAPTTNVAAQVRAPFLILHGDADTTVPPDRSELFKSVLDSVGVPNQRVIFSGVGHNLHNDRAEEVYNLIRGWFTSWGVLTNTSSAGVTTAGRPRGIFVLDSAFGTMTNGYSLRDANIRTNNFVEGYVLRAAWATLEPSAEVYDFSMIDNIISKLMPLGQKLSLIITPQDPAYLAATGGVATWQDTEKSGIPITRCVPWDPYLLQQRQKFLSALASHSVGGISFSNHPVLDVLDPYLAGGFTGVRDPNTIHLRDMPGYTRSNFLYAVQRELVALTTLFPGKSVQIGFWPVIDFEDRAYDGVPAAEYIRLQLLNEFDGINRPKVGFFMENLAASRPAPGQDPVTGYPVTTWATPLVWSQDRTWTAFQALGSWSRPFNPDHISKTTNGTPADAISFAFENYGCTYFELYANDIDTPGYQPALETWHRRLTAPAPAVECISEPPPGFVLHWDRAATRTDVLISTNLTQPFAVSATVTNKLNWTPPWQNSRPTMFLRIRQND